MVSIFGLFVVRSNVGRAVCPTLPRIIPRPSGITSDDQQQMQKPDTPNMYVSFLWFIDCCICCSVGFSLLVFTISVPVGPQHSCLPVYLEGLQRTLTHIPYSQHSNIDATTPNQQAHSNGNLAVKNRYLRHPCGLTAIFPVKISLVKNFKPLNGFRKWSRIILRVETRIRAHRSKPDHFFNWCWQMLVHSTNKKPREAGWKWSTSEREKSPCHCLHSRNCQAIGVLVNSCIFRGCVQQAFTGPTPLTV